MSRRPSQPEPNFTDILEYLRKDADSYGRMDERIEVLETSVSKLERILLDGSGEQSALIHQVLEVKLNLSVLKETVIANEAGIRSALRENQDARRIQSQSRTAVIIALIAAVASLIAAYISVRGGH